jgi:subtilisin family serine protease
LEVAGGHNFVANSDDYADDVGHGTHVAGTIAAVHNGMGLVGVAPKVQLYALKVLNSQGSGRTSDIVEGLEWAVDHHLQVLNMSFGASRGSQTEQRAIEAAAQAGIVMVAAAGNDGGPVGYPAAYPQVISVGAVDKSGTIARFSNRGAQLSFVAPGVNILSTVPEKLGFTFSLAARDGSPTDLDASSIRYSAATPPEGVTGPVRSAGRGTKEEVAAVDLKGAIALMERGDITFSEKVANAAEAGAVGALIFNSQPGAYAGTLGSTGAIPALSLTREDGLPLKDSGDVTVHLYVTPNSLYTRFSGTSMASPHVAGVAALVLSVRSELDPGGVRQILKQSATDLGVVGRDNLYGDGLVNAAAAVKAARDLPAMP